MSEESDHAACVEAWRTGVGGDLPAASLLEVFELAFRAVWRRAGVTLGDVTLTAIGDRVLFYAGERYPLLAALRLEPDGVSCEDLARDAESLDAAELDEALQFVLVELLTVLGRITGDVLTPALHAELSADQEPVP